MPFRHKHGDTRAKHTRKIQYGGQLTSNKNKSSRAQGCTVQKILVAVHTPCGAYRAHPGPPLGDLAEETATAAAGVARADAAAAIAAANVQVVD